MSQKRQQQRRTRLNVSVLVFYFCVHIVENVNNRPARPRILFLTHSPVIDSCCGVSERERKKYKTKKPYALRDRRMKNFLYTPREIF
jgi:hypothetical protein